MALRRTVNRAKNRNLINMGNNRPWGSRVFLCMASWSLVACAVDLFVFFLKGLSSG